MKTIIVSISSNITISGSGLLKPFLSRHMNNIDIEAPISFILIAAFCVFKVGLYVAEDFCSNYTCPQYCSKKYHNYLVSVLKCFFFKEFQKCDLVSLEAAFCRCFSSFSKYMF